MCALVLACVFGPCVWAQTTGAPAGQTGAAEPAAAEPAQGAQAVDAPLPEMPEQDVLLFRDGDKVSGQLLRIDRSAVVFQSNKTGPVTAFLGVIADLKTKRRFAVFKTGQKITRANALIGSIELKGDDLIVTPVNGGAPVAIKSYDIEYVLEDTLFEQEIAKKTSLHEGWTAVLSGGGTLIRSTEEGLALNTDILLMRQLPGVEYLPRRNRTIVSARDTYELVQTEDTSGLGLPATENKTHIFHADLERDEYVNDNFYYLGTYAFDRNYAQGLEAQHFFGGGVGWTVVRNASHQLDLKTDLHRTTQGFEDPSYNETLYGQKFIVQYERILPGGVSFHTNLEYIAAYNDPHAYAANTVTLVAVPLFRHIGVTISGTDNYLNHVPAHLRRNTFRLVNSITYTFP